MLIRNLDIEKGLVNGAIGTVQNINSGIPYVVFDNGEERAINYEKFSNPNLIGLPSFSFSGDSAVSGDAVTLYNTGGTKGLKTNASVTLEQTILNETTIDVELRDQVFLVDVPNLFLRLNDGRVSPNNVDNQQRASYTLTRTSTSSTSGGSLLSFSIGVKSLTQTLYDVYGVGTSKDVIKTYVRVTGMQSGTVRDIAVNVNQTA